MQGRLNIFQRTMLRWNDLHPYNSVHAVQIPAPFDATKLRESIHSTLKGLGPGALTLARDRHEFQYDSSPLDCEIKVLEASEDVRLSAEMESEAQINQPFEQKNSFSPFRFFVASGEKSFYLGLVYFHPAADGESAAALLKAIVDFYFGRTKISGPLNLYPQRHDRLAQLKPALLLKKLLQFARVNRMMRQSRRARSGNELNMQNRCTFVSLGAEGLEALLCAGKEWNVTVNDLLLALQLRCALRVISKRTDASKRPYVSVGCIANLRKELGFDAQTFGLFLGSFVVTERIREGIPFQELAESVRDQTARIKRGRLFSGMPLDVAFAGLMLKRMSTERRIRFYPKNYPLWGGVTNMNLNALWGRREENEGFDYFRAVSTGPATPLVFSVTTFGRAANIGISYRSTVYSPKEIDLVKQCLLETIAELRTRS